MKSITYVYMENIEAKRLNSEQLTQAGILLFGNQWQTNMAKSLGIDSRRVRDWLQGRRPVPIGIKDEIIKMLKDNSKKTLEFAEKLSED